MSRLWDIIHQRPTTSIDQLVELEDRTRMEEDTMTPAESAAKDIIFESIEKLCIITLGTIMPGKRKTAETAIRTQLENIESWLSNASMSFESQVENIYPLAADLRVPTWHYFHETHVLLDVCYFTHATLNLIDSNVAKVELVDLKFLAASSKRIRKLINKCFTNAHQAASKIQGQLKQKSAASAIVKEGIGQPGDTEDLIGVELRKVIDVPWMERFAAHLRESWAEALNGITQIKAP